MQKPTIGRIVIFKSTNPEHHGNSYVGEVPAIITCVHSDTCVNLQVMRDGASPMPITSVIHADDPAAPGSTCTWRWPDRAPVAEQPEVEAVLSKISKAVADEFRPLIVIAIRQGMPPDELVDEMVKEIRGKIGGAVAIALKEIGED